MAARPNRIIADATTSMTVTRTRYDPAMIARFAPRPAPAGRMNRPPAHTTTSPAARYAYQKRTWNTSAA